MTTNTNNDKQTCVRCKVGLPFSHFNVKRSGDRMLGCRQCNTNKRIYINKSENRCEHGRLESQCRECGGGQICEHDRIRSRCKDCGGGGICEHDRRRDQCRECDGSQICEHDRQRSQCKDCGGGSICEHDRLRSTCKVCNPGGHLKNLNSTRTHYALKGNKELHSQEYLGCDIETFKKHIEDQFEEGMNWDTHGNGEGKWNIDHIVPIKFNNPTFEEEVERLSYLNTQPLWACDNLAKGNRHCGV